MSQPCLPWPSTAQSAGTHPCRTDCEELSSIVTSTALLLIRPAGTAINDNMHSLGSKAWKVRVKPFVRNWAEVTFGEAICPDFNLTSVHHWRRLNKHARAQTHARAWVEWLESKEPADKQQFLTSSKINRARAWERQPANLYNNVKKREGLCDELDSCA